jgi:hypothetical protein
MKLSSAASGLVLLSLLSSPESHAAPPQVSLAFQGQVESAERIADPYQRCLAYPKPTAYQWDDKVLEAFCADSFAPTLAWRELESEIEAGRADRIDARLDTMFAAFKAGGIAEGTLYYDSGSCSSCSGIVAAALG